MVNKANGTKANGRRADVVAPILRCTIVMSGLLNNCKKRFFCWLKQLVKYYERPYACILKLYIVKMSDWYQINPKVCLYCTFSSTTMSNRSLPLN